VPAPIASTTDDPANAGIRREPELPEHEEIAPEPRKAVHEFKPMEDEPEEGTMLSCKRGEKGRSC
jgi:type IV secretion system protein VirD4